MNRAIIKNNSGEVIVCAFVDFNTMQMFSDETGKLPIVLLNPSNLIVERVGRKSFEQYQKVFEAVRLVQFERASLVLGSKQPQKPTEKAGDILGGLGV